MKLKKSEKVYCIKSWDEYHNMRFNKGNLYMAKYDPSENLISLIDNSNKTLSFKTYSSFNTYTISEYFITTNELRKQKLEKLKFL